MRRGNSKYFQRLFLQVTASNSNSCPLQFAVQSRGYRGEGREGVCYILPRSKPVSLPHAPQKEKKIPTNNKTKNPKPRSFLLLFETHTPELQKKRNKRGYPNAAWTCSSFPLGSLRGQEQTIGRCLQSQSMIFIETKTVYCVKSTWQTSIPNPQQSFQTRLYLTELLFSWGNCSVQI